MKRIRIDQPLTKDDPWTELSRLFGIRNCSDPQEFEHRMLQLREPVILETASRKYLGRQVSDILESIQQKSDCVYVIWGA